MYEERTYRQTVDGFGLVKSSVFERESDLFILAKSDVTESAVALTRELRAQIEKYILSDNEFFTTLLPYTPRSSAPLIVRQMAASTAKFGVGPMACVAGATAKYVGEQLTPKNGDVIVENGGDIYVNLHREAVFSLYAGDKSPFSGKVNFKTGIRGQPYGVCTSSGSVGHSLSFGKADAVCIVCDDALDADAAATAVCNLVKTKDDVKSALQFAQGFREIRGVIIAIDDVMTAWGCIEFV